MSNQNEITIERIFDAPRDLVWKVWTDPELLTKWWGPKGFTSPECKIDLRVGGKYHYCMRTPDGQDLWSTGTFREVVPTEKIVYTDSFSNEKGDIVSASEFGMSSDWPLETEVVAMFEDVDSGKTKLSLHYQLPESSVVRDVMLSSGMNEGWQESLDKMEEVINASVK